MSRFGSNALWLVEFMEACWWAHEHAQLLLQCQKHWRCFNIFCERWRQQLKLSCCQWKFFFFMRCITGNPFFFFFLANNETAPKSVRRGQVWSPLPRCLHQNARTRQRPAQPRRATYASDPWAPSVGRAPAPSLSLVCNSGRVPGLVHKTVLRQVLRKKQTHLRRCWPTKTNCAHWAAVTPSFPSQPRTHFYGDI